MQKYAENCSFYVLKVQKFDIKLSLLVHQMFYIDSLPTLIMHLLINNALLKDKKKTELKRFGNN